MSTVTFGGLWDAILERLLEVRPPGELGVRGLPGGSGGDAGLDSFGGGGGRRLESYGSVSVIDRLELASCGQLIRADSTAVPVSKHLFVISQYNNGIHITN